MGGIFQPDWVEIGAFSLSSGTLTDEWEKRLMSKMCAAFVTGYIEGTEPLSMPPYERED